MITASRPRTQTEPMSSGAALFSMLFLAVAVLVWQLLRGLHERALVIAAKSCRDAGLQLLDATVSLQQLRFTNNRTHWGWQLDYGFDVSVDGQRRLHGRIRFHQGVLQWIEVPRADGEKELWMPGEHEG